MPCHNYKCSECNTVIEVMIGATTGLDAPTDCNACGAKDTMSKQFGMSGISGEVVGGFEYEYGKKSWKRNKSDTDQAGIISGEMDPY